MSALFADESFPLAVVEALRGLGHDILTALEAGQANQAIPDETVLQFASHLERAVLTLNRWDFVKLHAQSAQHAGILACSPDTDVRRQTAAIDHAVRQHPDLHGLLLRTNRPE